MSNTYGHRLAMDMALRGLPQACLATAGLLRVLRLSRSTSLPGARCQRVSRAQCASHSPTRLLASRPCCAYPQGTTLATTSTTAQFLRTSQPHVLTKHTPRPARINLPRGSKQKCRHYRHCPHNLIASGQSSQGQGRRARQCPRHRCCCWFALPLPLPLPRSLSLSLSSART